MCNRHQFYMWVSGAINIKDNLHRDCNTGSHPCTDYQLFISWYLIPMENSNRPWLLHHLT